MVELNLNRLSFIFLVTIWLLILPFAFFETGGFGFADRYVYFSGLFFMAFVVMTLQLLISMNIAQWKTASERGKNGGRELLLKYPVLPPSPVFLTGFPDGAGWPGNYIDFLYNKSFVGYFYINDTVEEAAAKYVCDQDQFDGNPPHGIVYEQETFNDVDLIAVVKQIDLSKTSLNCSQ